MMEDSFVEHPVFSEEVFRIRYRMSHNVFNRISSDLCRYDQYFVQKLDAAKKVGLLPQQKLTCSLRMLTYGAGEDQCAEYCRMAKSTSIEALKRFTRGIVNLYSAEYLRAPTPADLRRLLTKAERRGFPGMIGSIDCMYWQWKNCPTGWAGEYSGRKRVPTMILEAVTSYDTWIWHAFFGMPRSCNDLNVLAKSPFFDELTAGQAPPIQFQVNNRIHNLGFYLADGIYSQWATFVKSIPSIVQGAARGWDREDLQYIMLTCIILHNMIIKDERPDDNDEDLESDEEEDNNIRPRLAQVWEGPTGDDFDPVGRDGYYFNGFRD
ncbi:uncharacterized protein LOC112201912 [Rosa chinensis]|uniref:uncharacterized protein LOC112201912 n=1 Tax=Rosa chinensis TaxID=74649 RepID=UPI000D0964AE|nr:uncharacterized protein LOC112201912 [Rosa chinensis]